MAGGKVKSAKSRKGSAKKSKTASKSRPKKASSAAKAKAPKRRQKAKSKTKPKTTRRKAAKRATSKGKPAKRTTSKGKPAKRTTSKRKAVKKRPGAAVKRVVSAAKRARKRRPTRIEALLFSELENLAQFIHAAKDEIAQIRPDEVKDDFLPKAAFELDAIVEATAEATHNIMDACDTVEGVSASLDGDDAQKLMDATTKIYEACTFQDITGQRIGKVVSTLHHIEQRIDKLVEVFDVTLEKSEKTNKAEAPDENKEEEKKKVSDGDLLEGPQLKGQGRSQAEIDDLLASFD